MARQQSSDGRLQIGNDLENTAPTALIEAQRDALTGAEPMQGLSTQARLSGAVSNVLEWVVHKLELLGTNGISRQVAAFRVQLTHNNSGVSTDADLRAGDFEVVTQQSAGQALAVRAAVTNQVGATLTDGIGVRIDLQNSGTLTNAYGLKIEDVNQGSSKNYAIQTGQGDVEFGGDVEIKGTLTAPTFTATQKGLVPNPGTASGRYLKDDGTWGTITLPASWTRIDKGLHYSSGNVGIGTPSPDGLLHVFSGSGGKITPNINADDLVIENSTNAGISILAPDASNTNLIFGSPSDAVGAIAQWNYDADQFRIGSHVTGAELVLASGNNVEAMRIDKDGNIGVGEAPDSDYKLNVVGISRFTGIVDVGGLTLQPAASELGEGGHLTLLGAGSHPAWNFDVAGPSLRLYNTAPGTRQVQIFSYSVPDAKTGLYVQGNTGIGILSPTQKLDVRGNVRADDYIEYSNMFTGDALTAIKAIRPEATDAPTDLSTTSDWAEVDHTTLPDRVKIAIQEEYYVNKHTGEQLAANKSPDQTDAPDDWELRTEETLGRSVGAGVQLNLRAIQQLIEQNEQLQAHNEQITKRLEQLEAQAQ